MKKQKDSKQLKKKLMSALAMLLIATVLMTGTSYAWLVLSIAPEVTGITTNIGANGALEIALLTTQTREDLSLIATSVGESLKAENNPDANNTWGNLIDLSYAKYGMNDILLMPSRLKVSSVADGYSVGSNLLSVPTYGYDGRISELTDNTMSAVYDSEEFSLILGQQDFGVRAIGTTDTLSVQGSALALAKSNIKTYTQGAQNATTSALNKHGDTLFNILITYSANQQTTYTDTDRDALKDLIENLQTAADYIDLSLRQGIVAFAASEVSGKDAFMQIKDTVMDPSKSLDQLMGETAGIPTEYAQWIAALGEIQNDLNAAENVCNDLTDGSYTWDEIRNVLNFLMNVDKVYINDTLFPEFDKSTAGSLIGGSVELTLAPDSGVFADIAEFTGNYNTALTVFGTHVEIATAINVDIPYLSLLSEAVKDLEPADNTGEVQEAVPLTATYGYALDLAFRCNAPNADLLLQTTAENRLYEEAASGATMGGGSYMEFTTKDSAFSLEKMIQLMDAIRVAFIDDQNKILGIAKLNTSNRTIIEGAVKSPLYLYQYSQSGDDGSIIMGERRFSDNVITDLTQNEAKAVTAVVWLDGDIVDNTMVSATEASSLNGVLNLQFATSANLIPANNTELLNVSADKTALGELLTKSKKTMDQGQGTYTITSWDAFGAAYDYANAVNENPNANDNQVYTAAYNLKVAEGNLENVSAEALQNKASQIRQMMGTSENVARYVVKNADGSYTTVMPTDQNDSVGEIKQVDYHNNLHNEGEEIFTPIYTDESWLALADALYTAEAALMNPQITDEQIHTVLNALEAAENALQRRVFYKPYEYNGCLYFEAICNANDADTYGKWYDSDFNRVVADITVLNLDAYAEPANIAVIEQDGFVPEDAGTITPAIDILDAVYPKLRNEEIIGANWSADVAFFINNDRHINPDSDPAEIFELNYPLLYPQVNLSLTGQTGKTSIEAIVLTKSGILFNVSKNITIYEPAEGAEITGNSAMQKGDSQLITADVLYASAAAVPEHAVRWIWASENTQIATVSQGSDGNCTVTAVEAGTVNITVSIETEEGNVYTNQIQITVS